MPPGHRRSLTALADATLHASLLQGRTTRRQGRTVQVKCMTMTQTASMTLLRRGEQHVPDGEAICLPMALKELGDRINKGMVLVIACSARPCVHGLAAFLAQQGHTLDSTPHHYGTMATSFWGSTRM